MKWEKFSARLKNFIVKYGVPKTSTRTRTKLSDKKTKFQQNLLKIAPLFFSFFTSDLIQYLSGEGFSYFSSIACKVLFHNFLFDFISSSSLLSWWILKIRNYIVEKNRQNKNKSEKNKLCRVKIEMKNFICLFVCYILSI